MCLCVSKKIIQCVLKAIWGIAVRNNVAHSLVKNTYKIYVFYVSMCFKKVKQITNVAYFSGVNVCVEAIRGFVSSAFLKKTAS